MTLDLRDHTAYKCRYCRHECINHEDSTEARQQACTDCLVLQKVEL